MTVPNGPDPSALPPTPPPSGSPVPRPVPPVRRPVRTGPPLVPVAGAVPVEPAARRRPKPPLAWLPWALLAALLALLGLMLLAGAVAGSDDDAARTPRSSAAAAAPRTGTLVSGGVDLLQDRASLGRLVDLQAQRAVGRGVLVQSVVADEGFWVGSSAAERVFVYLTPEARKSSGESGFRVQAGQHVDLNGTVTGTSAGDPQRFGVTDAEGARQLTAQRAYVRATQVRLSS